MRFSKSFWNVSPALVATTALFLITGVAGAVIDANESIDADSPDYDGSGGWVHTSGNTFRVGVEFQCVDADNEFWVACSSTHPDKVKLSTHQGKVDQMKKGNSANFLLMANKLGGKVVDFPGEAPPLTCERVSMKGKLHDFTKKIESRCIIKNCDIPDWLTVPQIESAIRCLDDSEDTGDLGKKVQTLKLDRNDQLGGRIWSKGAAVPD
jgi:hypothetical protein